MLWSPWRIELPPLKNRREFVLEIEVSNTLANEITSQRVRDAWAQAQGTRVAQPLSSTRPGVRGGVAWRRTARPGATAIGDTKGSRGTRTVASNYVITSF